MLFKTYGLPIQFHAYIASLTSKKGTIKLNIESPQMSVIPAELSEINRCIRKEFEVRITIEPVIKSEELPEPPIRGPVEITMTIPPETREDEDVASTARPEIAF